MNETVGDLVPLRVVSVDGREWGKGTVSVPTAGRGKRRQKKNIQSAWDIKNGKIAVCSNLVNS